MSSNMKIIFNILTVYYVYYMYVYYMYLNIILQIGSFSVKELLFETGDETFPCHFIAQINCNIVFLI